MIETATSNCAMRKSGRGLNRAMMLLAAAAALFALNLTTASMGHAQGRTIRSFQVQDMDFGEFVAIASSGTIVLAPNGTPTYNSVLATGGAVLTAEFELRGERFDTFVIDLPSQIFIAGATGNMLIDTFTSEPAGSGVFNGQGKASITVGATMHMTSQMASGLYSGSFDITFTYETIP